MASTRFNQKYGPEGIVLMGAALATSLPGVLLAWAGIALIVVSRDRNPLGSIASWMLAFSLLLIVLSSIRLQQAKDAGERFNARQKREPGDAPGQDIV
jgi:hypothetical protein